jgi:hypothetical protein
MYMNQAGTRSQENPRKRPVIMTNTLTMERIRFESATAAAKSIGAIQSMVSAACNGARRGVNEYRFEYQQAVVPALDDEEWAAVMFDDVDTKWQVSNFGRLLRPDGQLATNKPTRAGYVRVTIKGKSPFLHKLVANAFLPAPIDPVMTIDHIDRNKANNRADNLRWYTPSQQVRHALDAGRKTAARTKPVEYRKIGTIEWMRADCVTELTFLLGLNRASLALAAKRAGKHGGYEFRYEEMPDLPGEVWREVDIKVYEADESNDSSTHAPKRQRCD